MNICVVSDTHLQNDLSLLPAESIAIMQKADLLIHCGDIVSNYSYEYFRGLNKYFVAVQGNWDYDLPFLPLKELLQIEDLKIGIVHGHIRLNKKASLTTELNVISMFAGLTPDMIFFGHTHQITDKVYGKVRLINPGSLVEGKRSLICINIEKGEKTTVEVKRFD